MRHLVPTRALASVVLFAIATVATHVAYAAEAITLDDLLRADSVDDVWFAPDGRSIAYTQSVPIAERTTWGYDDASLAGARVFVAARDGGEPREIAASGDVRYRLLPEKTWRPDSAGLMLIAARNTGFGLAYWDAASGRTTQLPGRPPEQFVVLDWLRDRAIYAVLPEGGYQRGSNRQVLANVERRWRGTWDTQAAQATVSSANPMFATSAPAAGALMLADPRDGSATRIADGDFIAVSASPDGMHFAAVRAAELVPDSYYVFGNRGELSIFARSGDGAKLLRRHADLDVSFARLAWSPRGDRLLAGGKPASAGKADTQLYVIDANTGAAHGIDRQGLSLANAQMAHMGGVLPFGWLDGQPIAVAARPGAAAGPAARAPSAVARLDYGETRDLRFDVYAFARGKARNLTAFARASVTALVAPPQATQAYAIADGALWRIGARTQRVSIDGAPTIAGFGIERRYPEPAPITAYHRSGDDERLALYVLDADQPRHAVLDLRTGKLAPTAARGELAAVAPDFTAAVSIVAEGWSSRVLLRDGAGERALVRSNAALADKAVAAAERFEFTANGQQLTGWLLRPPHAAPGVALPAVVSVYGGMIYGDEQPRSTRANAAGGSPIFNAQLLAAHGYAVILPSTPLGAGADTDLMQTLADQAVAAVDALAARGIVDPQRVGVTGQSFGGFSTAAILAARSDRFKAGVALAGVYDWTYGYGNRALGDMLADDGRLNVAEAKMIETGQSRLGQPFWRAAEAYARNSPIFHVDRINAPLLMLHGDLDMGLTSLAGAERMYAALVRAGKQPALVRYWGEGHVAQSAASIRDQWMRMTMWFDGYLGLRAGSAAQDVSPPPGAIR